jgi:hypothetical protein
MVSHSLVRLGPLCALCFGLQCCLPAPELKPHGSVYAYVTPSAATRGEPFVTGDGWTVTVTEALAVIGSPIIGGQYCTTLGDWVEYGRLVSLRSEQPQKLGVDYGLGDCEVNLYLGAPEQDVIPGEGLTEQSVASFFDLGLEPPQEAELWVAGTATKGSESMRFAWSIWDSPSQESTCYPAATPTLHLEDGDELRVDYGFAAENLFYYRSSPKSSFNGFAQADALYGNGDGLVTYDEVSTSGWFQFVQWRSVLTEPAGWDCR